jgi:hypothetical protein
MKIKHTHAIILSGLTWVLIGSFLLFKGLHYILFATVFQADTSPLLSLFSKKENGTMILIAMGIAIGYAKGKFVFPRTVQRVVKRILSQDEPIQLKNLYSKGYLLLIGSMICLGMAMRFSSIPFDVRGVIDTGVGSALVVGSLLYFKQAIYLARRAKKQTSE